MRILYAESDKELRAFFGSKLRSEFKGTIDLASTGKEAIKLLKAERPYDVIVSDLILSNGSGVDILHFKEKNNISGSFIFFCTVKEKIPSSGAKFIQVDKFSFCALSDSIKKSVLKIN